MGQQIRHPGVKFDAGANRLVLKSARTGLYQAVLADPRRYNKSLVFEELAKNAIDMVKGDFELAKDAAR